MDYALQQPSTRADCAHAGRRARCKASFHAGARKGAATSTCPSIALKLARTQAAAAQMALSHTGAIAGDAAVYEALFRRYGVISVRDPGELAATATLLTAPRRAVAGGLSAILDSGGERELLVDVAADIGVPFARHQRPHRRSCCASSWIRASKPINPLDAWGTGREFEQVFETCLSALMRMPTARWACSSATCRMSWTCTRPMPACVRRRAGYRQAAGGHEQLQRLESSASLALRLTRAGHSGARWHARLAAGRGKHALAYRDFLARRAVHLSAQIMRRRIRARSTGAKSADVPAPHRSAKTRATPCSRTTASRCRVTRSLRTPRAPRRPRAPLVFRWR
jgi:hypothetical protein